jgi:predicted DsbA family dithiol-disulfide isomerase
MNPSIRIDVWSDYVCPFCYLELPVLERIAAERPDMEVRWHAFELRPEPVPTLDPGGDYLRDTWARAVYPMARTRGMAIGLPPVQPRSRKALEAAEFARAAGRFEVMHRALFETFFVHGEDLASIPLLCQIGARVGLDPERLRESLEQGAYEPTVLADQRIARSLGITGVPLMAIRRPDVPLAGADAVSGAQPYDVVAALIDGIVGSA